MKLGLAARAVILAALLSTPAHAQLAPSPSHNQIMGPIDRSKQADVNGKTLNYGDVSFDTLSKPISVLPASPLSKGDLKLQDLNQKKAEFNTLQMSTVSKPTLPKANFTTRRAEVDVPNDETKKQSDQTRKNAPINNRQIKLFTPAGEEELKHQLSEPPLEVH